MSEPLDGGVATGRDSLDREAAGRKSLDDGVATVRGAWIGGVLAIVAVIVGVFLTNVLQAEPVKPAPAPVIYTYRGDTYTARAGNGGSQMLAPAFDRSCGRVDPAVRRAALHTDGADMVLANGYRDPNRIPRGVRLRVPRNYVCPR
jgi:hypothetical protein